MVQEGELAQALGPWLSGEAQAAISHLTAENLELREDNERLVGAYNQLLEDFMQLQEQHDGRLIELATLQHTIHRLLVANRRNQPVGTINNPIDLTE